jgi:hypothetical protein
MLRPPIDASLLSALLLSALLLGGCGDGARGGGTEQPTPAQVQDAEQAVTGMEDRFRQLATLSPPERRQQEALLGKDLERVVAVATGTRYANKAFYFLANWRYSYADGAGADEALDQLATLPSPVLKTSGERLRVLLRLRQGRVSEARRLAEPLVQQVPEFSPLLARVLFHEQVGQVATPIVARNLNGGPEEPLAGRGEPWLLVLFVEALDDNALSLLRRYQDALAVLPAGQSRIVCVTFDSNLLGATARLRAQPGNERIDLLWASPAGEQAGSRAQWIAAWKLPLPLPNVALLGPGPMRTLMAVEIAPEALKQRLSDKAPAAK